MASQPKYFRLRDNKVPEFRAKYTSMRVIELNEKGPRGELTFHYLSGEDARRLGLGNEYGWTVDSGRAVDVRTLTANGLNWR